MISSINCEPGAIVLVWFRFTRGTAAKRRPAVILSGDDYHRSRRDAVMMALTTNLTDVYHGDVELSDWWQAGLPKRTKIKGVIQTIDRATVERRLGTLSAGDLANVRVSLHSILAVLEDAHA